MHWIDKFSKGTFQIYAGNVLEAFQPLDFFHFYPMWYDLWISQIVKVIDTLDLEHKTYPEIAHLLPKVSSLRTLLQKFIPSYRAMPTKNPAEARKLVTFVTRMLYEHCADDPFGETSNPIHTHKEIASLLLKLPWQKGNTDIAKDLGKLITAAGSLVHGQLNDLVTDLGWDAYGPYEEQVIHNQTLTLFVREFPDLFPSALWNNAEFLAPIQNLRVYGLYADTQFKLAGLGCHAVVTSGDPISGLRYFCVTADNKPLSTLEIKELIGKLSMAAEKIYQHIRTLNFEELKQMVMLQECYQLKKLFEEAQVDWKPTPEMIARVQDKPIPIGLIPHGTLMTDIEQYKEVFGINKFAQEVLAIRVD